MNEFIDWSAYMGTYEPDTLKAIKILIKNGMIFVDVGANSGLYSSLASKIVGEKGKVYAFEPTSYGYKKLVDNLILNESKNIESFQIGLSDKKFSTEVGLASSYPLKPINLQMIHPFHGGSIVKEKIKFMTLDSFDFRPDVVKIDTDGYEYKILKGTENTLRKNKPAIILELIQKTLAEKGDSENALIDYLSLLGYSFFTLDFVPITNLKNRHRTNIIAMHNDRTTH